MAESEKSPSVSKTESKGIASTTEKQSNAISFTIWPPTDATRVGVKTLLIETLSSSSILPKRYSRDEAIAAARTIEQEAFDVAASLPTIDNDAIAILQAYSKRISLRIVDKVKARSSKPNPAPAQANNATRKTAENDAVSN